jgi:hypothetical protein
MKQKVLYIIFLIAGTIPVYLFISWIYIFNNYPTLSQIEKQELYNQLFFGGFNITGNLIIKLCVVVLGLCSICYFSYQLFNKKNIQKNTLTLDILNAILIIVFSIFTLLSIWGLL